MRHFGRVTIGGGLYISLVHLSLIFGVISLTTGPSNPLELWYQITFAAAVQEDFQILTLASLAVTAKPGE